MANAKQKNSDDSLPGIKCHVREPILFEGKKYFMGDEVILPADRIKFLEGIVIPLPDKSENEVKPIGDENGKDSE